MISKYIEKTKALNVSNDSMNAHAPNEPSNDSVNVNTEDNQARTLGITHFKAIEKPKWKGRAMKEELD